MSSPEIEVVTIALAKERLRCYRKVSTYKGLRLYIDARVEAATRDCLLSVEAWFLHKSWGEVVKRSRWVEFPASPWQHLKQWAAAFLGRDWKIRKDRVRLVVEVDLSTCWPEEARLNPGNFHGPTVPIHFTEDFLEHGP